MRLGDRVAFSLLFYAWGFGFTATFVFFGAWGWIAFFGPIFLIGWAARPIVRWSQRRLYSKYTLEWAEKNIRR